MCKCSCISTKKITILNAKFITLQPLNLFNPSTLQPFNLQLICPKICISPVVIKKNNTALCFPGQSFAGRRTRPGCQPGKLIGSIERAVWMALGRFYLVKEDELVLGPFQGPVACTRIRKGRGVCGSAWERNETLIVPDVEKFPGHIACSSLSKSEIVVPLRTKGRWPAYWMLTVPASTHLTKQTGNGSKRWSCSLTCSR